MAHLIEQPIDIRVRSVIVGMAVVTSGLLSYFAHPVTLLAPVPLLAALLLLRDARLTSPIWIVSIAAAMIWAVLLYLAMAGTTRGLIYTLAMYAPFAALAYCIRRPVPVALSFAVVTTTLVSVRVLVSWLHAGAEWRAWTVYEGNDLASRLNVLLPLVLIARIELPTDKRLERGLLLLLVAAGVTSIVLTQERAALGVLVILVLIGLARNHWRSLPLVGAAALAVWLAASQSILALLERMRFVNFTPSNASRSEIWAVALDAVRESSWLGVGPGNSGAALREVGGGHAHNGLLQSALEAGWPGAAAYAALIIYLTVLAARLLRQGGMETVWALPLLAYMGFSVVSAPIQRPDSTLALVLVVMSARAQIRPRGEQCDA